ncbi:MAG: hypothetical protein DRP85_05980 [Candidatus Makaraimicrobium thalassicum]|nr:MAG: hypothetical protein DRP85_05980 [Candidatus Omnitrophota bacterium]
MTEAHEYLQGTVERYFKDLSERRIVPGGGSASAFTAALGAGLNLMVINYSINDGDPGGAPRGLLEARSRQQESLEQLLSLVDEDCAAFRELMSAISSGRSAQKEYTAAAAVPMKICRQCHASMDITAQLTKSANRNLTTDIGCAAYILKAAFCSARLNVEINLRRIEDRTFVEKAEKALEEMNNDMDGAEKELHGGID